MTGGARTPSPYQTEGVVALAGLFDHQAVEMMSSYAALLGHIGRLSVEEVQVPNSLVLYGDPLFDSVMASLVPTVTAHVGVPVVPTYSYVRLYQHGQELTPHRDRRACQHSVTLHISGSSSEPWPLALTDLQERDRELDLHPGDGVLYQGCAVRHWRTACPMEWYLQAFMHFVEAEGPFADQVFDGRPFLGLPLTRS